MARVVVDMPDNVDLSKVNDMKLCIRYYKDNDNNEYSYVTEGFTIQEERPQGEWIGKEEYDDYPNKQVCECSECGKMICVSHNDFPNFCENCGADMRKGEEE